MSVKNWARFVALGLIWGSSFLWIKIALQDIGPFTLVAFRIFFAFLGTLVLVLVKRISLPLGKNLGIYFFLGLFNMAVPFVLISWAEKFIPSGLAAILNSSMPLWTLLIAAFWLPEERLTPARVFGLLLGFAGVVVLMSNQLGEGFGGYQLGILAMLASALSYALSSVFTRLKSKGISSEALTFGQLIFAYLVVMPGAVGLEAPFRFPSSGLTWLAVIWLGLLGSCVALVLYFSMLHDVGPTRTSMATYIFPLVGVLLGTIFLGEQPDWRLLVGGLMIIAGVWWVNKRKK